MNNIEAFRTAILAALGHAPDVIEAGKFTRFSTNGKRGDKAGWCKLFDDERGGVFGCHRAQVSESWSATDRASMTPAERRTFALSVMRATEERHRMQRSEWAANAERIEALRRELVDLVPGDPVTLYLKRRGFAGVWPLPACLKLHPALAYWHEGECIGTFPAMVAPVVAADGRIVALHRTWLTRDGRKADVPTVRKLTRAAGPVAGACIPLFRPARGCIGIAEGIETAIAAWLASGVPTVAAYSAGNLAAWHWPAGVQRVVIFADNDESGTGTDAAERLRQRARAAGLRCDVLSPSEPGADWADVWAQRDAVLIEGAAA